MKKIPLIEYLLENYPGYDEKTLRSLIMQKKILIDETPVVKAGFKISPRAEVRLRDDKKFLTRAGEKLNFALSHFQLDFKDKVVIDSGCGSGGFTEILLNHGAGFVYAIDVGHSHFAYHLRGNPRVTLMEKTNIRSLSWQDFPHPPQTAVLDISFTSIRDIIPHVFSLISGNSMLVLIKPQFENTSRINDFDGIVRKYEDHVFILTELATYLKERNIHLIDLAPSKVKGRKGNQEFFAILGNLPGDSPPSCDIEDKVMEK